MALASPDQAGGKKKEPAWRNGGASGGHDVDSRKARGHVAAWCLTSGAMPLTCCWRRGICERRRPARSFTALGIVFGVGSVIGMLSIGEGAKEESLRFIEQLGVRNVLVESRRRQFRRTSAKTPEFSGPDGAGCTHHQGEHTELEKVSPRRTLHPADRASEAGEGYTGTVRCRTFICEHSLSLWLL